MTVANQRNGQSSTKKGKPWALNDKHPLWPFNRFDGEQFIIRMDLFLYRGKAVRAPRVVMLRDCPRWGGEAMREMNARNGVGSAKWRTRA